MTDERLDNPNKVEVCGNFFAEYRRVRDSRGEEEVGVTLRRYKVAPDDTLEQRQFHIEMDALERFASHQVAKDCYAKPFDPGAPPDAVECFKEYTAAFFAGTSSKSGREISAVYLTYAKETGKEPIVQHAWIRHEALQEFSARGIAYEQELELTKRWYPLVRVVALGNPEGIGVVQTLASVEDKGGARERAQRQADQSAEAVLWPYPFRRRFEVGDEFSVRGHTEGHFGDGKIGKAMINLYLLEQQRRLDALSRDELPRGYRQSR